MLSRLVPLALLLLGCASCASTPEAAAADSASRSASTAQDAAALELSPEAVAALSLAAPGPEHAVIEKFAGDWDCEMKLWMAPGAEPVTSTSRETSEMVLGGRFLRTHAVGEMQFGDTSYSVESMGMLGFDRRNGVFTTVGFDTMGTYYITASGVQDPETGAITMYGSDHDEATGVTQTYKFVFRLLDDDHYLIELYFTNPEMTHGLDEFKLMEMHYSRR